MYKVDKGIDIIASRANSFTNKNLSSMTYELLQYYYNYYMKAAVVCLHGAAAKLVTGMGLRWSRQNNEWWCGDRPLIVGDHGHAAREPPPLLMKYLLITVA